MSRGLWFVAGAGAGVYAMVRGRRAAEALTADGLRDRASALALGARLVRDEVAQGAAEAEPVLRERMGLAPPGPPELGVGAARPDDQPDPARTARTAETAELERGTT